MRDRELAQKVEARHFGLRLIAFAEPPPRGRRERPGEAASGRQKNRQFLDKPAGGLLLFFRSRRRTGSRRPLGPAAALAIPAK
jgi:hypothetical protein